MFVCVCVCSFIQAYEAKHLDEEMFYYTPAVHSAAFQLPVRARDLLPQSPTLY